ncbi:response regulator [Larkinella soli]|uniref:response regulator n=1 Tax=Larkinella soli TaxID=1770527 RepID=UPI000FFBA69F|nr:response regulator [Larkinella soli]
MDPFLIFLAEDDEDDAEIYLEYLKKTFPLAKVRLFNNGKELVEALDTSSLEPDFAILDINMPIMNGIDALAELRAQPATRDLPVYMLTSSDFDQHIERCHQLGLTTYFVKPFRVVDINRTFGLIRTQWLNRRPLIRS